MTSVEYVDQVRENYSRKTSRPATHEVYVPRCSPGKDPEERKKEDQKF